MPEVASRRCKIKYLNISLDFVLEHSMFEELEIGLTTNDFQVVRC